MIKISESTYWYFTIIVKELTNKTCSKAFAGGNGGVDFCPNFSLVKESIEL